MRKVNTFIGNAHRRTTAACCLTRSRYRMGVIFATPNYNWQMSGLMKLSLDRLSFVCHRPCYFGKAFTSIVTQSFAAENKIVENFDFAVSTMGFNI
jgi:hypothetical protein